MKNLLESYPNKQALYLHLGEEKYKALVENSVHAYFLTNQDGKILETNHVAMTMFGYSKNELLSLNKQSLFDCTDENLITALKNRKKNGFISVNATGIKKTGEHFPIELSSVIFSESNGDTRTSTMVYDISEHKIIEKRHLNNLELLQQAEKLAHQGSFAWDFKNNTLECSNEFLSIIGYNDKSKTPTINILIALLYNEDREYTLDALNSFINNEQEKEIRCRISLPGNTIRLLSIKAMIIRDSYNIAVKMIGIVKDITQDESSKQDLRQVIESITDGFFILDNDWIITYWNNEVEKLYGIKKDQILGHCFLNYFKELENLKFFTECRYAKQENVSVQFEEFYPSSNIWIEVHAYPSATGLTVFCKNITDQKTAAAEMKLSNERYDMVVKATNDLVWDWDIITGNIYRNTSGVERVYGHRSNESIKTNQQWSENIHPLDRERIDQQIAYYLNSENETSFNFEYRYKREDGNYNFINDKGYITRNDLGIVTRMIGAARDITEQKQAAQVIEESELRYKMFVQQSTEGIWRIELEEAKSIQTNPEELIEYCMKHAHLAECNDAFAKMYGFENAENIIGIPLNKLMPAENPDNLKYLNKFFFNNYKIENEISYEYNKEGKQLVFVNNMIGIIEGDLIKRAWGTQRDITEQKKAEASLLTSEEQYRYLFNNNPSCIFIWDINTLQIIEVNQAAIDLYEYSKEEFLQLNVLDIRPADESDKFIEMLDVARQYKVYKKTNTWRHINKSGQIIYMDITSHNFIYNGKKAVLAIGNNVTEKIQLENSLNEERQIRHKQITDAVITGQERERSELGEELHDNINQILASTRLYIECALTDENIRKDLLDKGRILLDSAMKEIRKLSRSLLPPSLGEVSLLEALTDLTNDSLQVKPIRITKKWKNFNETGLTDKQKLTIFRIVQEQLNNIYKHAKANHITIKLEKKENLIKLIIKDDGIGFDTLTKKSGVGLRNISSRAEVNNGSVHINSSPGAGCEVIVEFNIAV